MNPVNALRNRFLSSSSPIWLGRERMILFYPILLCLTVIPLGHILGIPTPGWFYEIKPPGVSSTVWNVILICFAMLIISAAFFVLDLICRPWPPPTASRSTLPIYLRPADGTGLAWLDWVAILLGIVAAVLGAVGRLFDPPFAALCLATILTGVISLITSHQVDRRS